MNRRVDLTWRDEKRLVDLIRRGTDSNSRNEENGQELTCQKWQTGCEQTSRREATGLE